MNTNLSPVLAILSEAETARKESCRRVCKLLSLDQTSTIASILVEKDNELDHQPLIKLLEEVSQIVGEHGVRRTITDWPFENFWGNPHEPRHSKLLGYFIDPLQKHDCDYFLRRKLLEVLENALKASECLPPVPRLFPADGCKIYVESEHIDLLIERRGDGRNYAVIIENKINWAKNQNKQLQTYVECVRGHEFKYTEIYVFYLPLTNDKEPDPGDRAWLKKQGVKYNKITFEKHILDWLNAVLEESKHEWPQNMHIGMSENLNHYRSLIKYLNQKQKEREMNAKILEKLKLKNELPTWSDLEALKQSIESLQQCMKQVLRGKLLLEIQSILKTQGEDVWLCLESKSTEKIYDVSPYDELFGNLVNLCVRADETVSVCFGYNPTADFWLGYMRSGSPDKQKEAVILSEARKRLINMHEEDSLWYGWVPSVVTCDGCEKQLTFLAKTYSETLVKMRNNLVDQLKGKDVRS